VEYVTKERLEELRFFAGEENMIMPLPYGAVALAIPELGQYGIQKPVLGGVVYIDVAIYADDTKPPMLGSRSRQATPCRFICFLKGLSLQDFPQ
jgi:hypothetical protein